MLKKLFKLSAICTVLSLVFISVSCKSNESTSFSGSTQPQLSEAVYLDQSYVGERKAYGPYPKSTIYMKFLPGNIIEITDSNDFRDKVETLKITNVLANPDDLAYEVQYRYTSVKMTLKQKKVVDAGNKGNLGDQEIWAIEDIPSTIKNWKLYEAKDISSIIKPVKKRVFTMYLTISVDKRHVSTRDAGDSEEETLDLTLQQ